MAHVVIRHKQTLAYKKAYICLGNTVALTHVSHILMAVFLEEIKTFTWTDQFCEVRERIWKINEKVPKEVNTRTRTNLCRIDWRMKSLTNISDFM